MPRRRALETALVLLAVVAAIVPLPATGVERWFSTGIYPRVQRVLTPIGNIVPFAFFDLILVAVVALTVTLVVRGVRRARRERRWSPVLQSGWHLIATAAVLYLVFLGCWGLNYRRVSMPDRLEMTDRGPQRANVSELGMTAVTRLNALHDVAHAQGWTKEEWRDPRLVQAFAEAQRLVEDSPQAIPGRLKHTLLGPYFRWSGVDGMVDPYALEVLANPDLLPWERPFVAAHEWSHLAGFADESEASFVGWLACLRAHEAAQYSGWLFLYWEVMNDLPSGDRERLSSALDDGPRRDLVAIVQRLQRGQLPLLRNASWAVYDQYLRANRVEEGVRSYGEVVTLILRARFADGYRPIRRATPASSR